MPPPIIATSTFSISAALRARAIKGVALRAKQGVEAVGAKGNKRIACGDIVETHHEEVHDDEHERHNGNPRGKPHIAREEKNADDNFCNAKPHHEYLRWNE